MASKREIKLWNGKTMQGYDANGVLGLYLEEQSNLWRAVHLSSGRDLCGPDGRWKRKRSCLIFIEEVAHFNWDVSDEQSMYDANGGYEMVLPVYLEAVKKALEAE